MGWGSARGLGWGDKSINKRRECSRSHCSWRASLLTFRVETNEAEWTGRQKLEEQWSRIKVGTVDNSGTRGEGGGGGLNVQRNVWRWGRKPPCPDGVFAGPLETGDGTPMTTMARDRLRRQSVRLQNHRHRPCPKCLTNEVVEVAEDWVSS